MTLRKQTHFTLLSVNKIWDRAPHNAMTDLIRFKNRWFCTFRESDNHVQGENGKIRIIVSDDSLTWSSIALFFQEGVDLRDPKFSITPHGQLMLLVGGTIYHRNVYQSLQSRVSFSQNGKEWSPFSLIIEPHEWLWRVTWHLGKAYGASYSRSDPQDGKKPWNIKLYESPDGINFNILTSWDIPGHPNETTLRFLKSGKMIALVRCDGYEDNRARIGIADPPYTEWKWTTMKHYFGGPNFLVLPRDLLIAAGRILINTPYAQFERTAIASMNLEQIYPSLILPSQDDCSYPGLVFHEKILWVSYYSSHESNTSVYLARVAI
jgi:hypothetical protein